MTTRRDFLRWAGFTGSGLLAGCSLDPGTRTWGAFSWAEGLTRSLLGMSPLGHALAREYPDSAITPDFPIRSLNVPDGYAGTLASWKLTVGGLVERPLTLTLDELAARFAKVSSTTRHDCVEGWSAIARWSGVRLADLLSAIGPAPSARYVIFRSADADDDGTPFYGSLELTEATHPQVLLAYEMNGAPLSVDHGAPLRLKVPNQLGYKSTKFIHRIDLVASLSGIGGGRGGYWEDQGYERYAGI